jgi:hypothetical protein
VFFNSDLGFAGDEILFLAEGVDSTFSSTSTGAHFGRDLRGYPQPIYLEL